MVEQTVGAQDTERVELATEPAPDGTHDTRHTPYSREAQLSCQHNPGKYRLESKLKRNVIIGDSNVSRIPAFSFSNLQIDSFPVVKFQHAGNLMERATVALEPEILIFSCGINNKSHRFIMTTTKEIQRT